MFNFSQIQTKYFWIAIIVIGTIGIWLPFLLGENISFKEIPMLLTTYYVSIYFSGCLDSVMNKIKEASRPNSNHEIVTRFLDVIGLILLSIALIIATIMFNKNGFHKVATFIAVIGTIIALYLWWKNHYENQTFDRFIRDGVDENHGKTW